MVIAAYMPGTLIIMKWLSGANKIVKVKEICIDHPVIAMNFVVPEHPSALPWLCAGTSEGFQLIDIEACLSEMIDLEEFAPKGGLLYTNSSYLPFGLPVAVYQIKSGADAPVGLCFERASVAISLDDSEDRSDDRGPFKWRRFPLCFSAAFGEDLFVSGFESVLDIWSLSLGRIVHIFETKKNKLQSLKMLTCRKGTLFLQAREERDGAGLISLLVIQRK